MIGVGSNCLQVFFDFLSPLLEQPLLIQSLVDLLTVLLHLLVLLLRLDYEALSLHEQVQILLLTHVEYQVKGVKL